MASIDNMTTDEILEFTEKLEDLDAFLAKHPDAWKAITEHLYTIFELGFTAHMKQKRGG